MATAAAFTPISLIYILTFADSSVADFWWRLLSEDDSLKQYDIRRIKPQYYVGSLKDLTGYNKVLCLEGENRPEDRTIVLNAMSVRPLDGYSSRLYPGPGSPRVSQWELIWM
ncbi:hypothetical protein BDZ91DRAFT_760319 [Kalaharituber pfeilii]|nr:hypothetical protein BDZ91DRAFT_760319 [Kalaharituber pfeilii]